MAFPRRCYGVHRDLTAFKPRLYGTRTSMAFSRHVIYITVLLWRLPLHFHGVYGARVELLSRSMAFYDIMSDVFYDV